MAVEVDARVALEALFRRAGLEWTVGAVSDDWLVAGRFVALGLGIAAVNDPVRVEGCTAVALSDGPVHAYRLFWRRGIRLPDLPVLPKRTVFPGESRTDG